ncbi:MAG: 50S ribosomal protein L3 N(5)-glutamine methyltransferase [Burkholderiaceae bacterium]|nr:50S ribosomal protein L3 N(5)-glutamine methyltransferase [Burkholderiaceae bacterium]
MVDRPAGGASSPRRVVASSEDAASSLRTVRDLVRHSVSRLCQARVRFGHGTDDVHDEAIWLVCWVLHLPVAHYDALADATVAWPEIRAVLDLVERRCSERRPLAYLVGEAWLMGYRFRCDARALVPRSLIAEALLQGALEPHLPPRLRVDEGAGARILDLCTGGGSLAIIAASAWPAAEVTGSDLSAEALALAAENVDDYELGARVHLVQGDLFAGLSRQRFDLILCNPPYVNARSMAALPAEFRAEPQAALAGGEDGMDLVVRILATAHAHLQPDGLLVLEIGHEARHFERRFPRLEWAWVGVAEGENRIVAVDAGALREAAGAQDGPRRRR